MPRIATNEDPFESAPFIGNLGNAAYFVAGTFGGSDQRWLLVGIDVLTGQRLFSPVPLGVGPRAPECFLNGPTALLCLSRDGPTATAWVIDAKTGAVTYVGSTDLRTSPAELMVHQLGIYAVAETQDQGIYGVGPRAETTWFVPGEGSIDQKYLGARDTTALSLITQAAGGPDGKVVVSLADGTVIKAQTEGNAEQQQTVVYPGGFAAIIERGENEREVRFFDDTGKRTSAHGVKGLLSPAGADLPVVSLTAGGWAAYTPNGDEILDEPGKAPQQARLIGTSFFVETSGDGMVDGWQQYDLRSGAKGKNCSYDLGSGYLATDGAVAILMSGNPNVGLVMKAVDLASCDHLWSIKSPVGSFRDVWRINTSLVQLSDNGTELMSLVTPR